MRAYAEDFAAGCAHELGRGIVSGKEEPQQKSGQWKSHEGERGAEVAEQSRDRWTDEADAKDDGADACRPALGEAQGDCGREGFADEDEVILAGELLFDELEEIAVAQAAVGRVSDHLARDICGHGAQQGCKELGGAVEAGEKHDCGACVHGSVALGARLSRNGGARIVHAWKVVAAEGEGGDGEGCGVVGLRFFHAHA